MSDMNSQFDLPEDEEVSDVLQRWCALSALQRKALLGLANEVQTSSDLIEKSVSGLSENFLDLATLAQGQAKRISDFADETTRIEYDGRHLSISDVFSSLEDSLTSVVVKILNLSKNTVQITYSLDDMDQKVQTLYENNKSNPETSSLLLGMMNDLECAKNNVKGIATIDVSDNLDVKDRLSSLMSYLILQSQNMEETLNASAEDSRILSKNIGDIVTKMQFQDRTSQRLDLISTSLNVLSDTLNEMEASSLPLIGEEMEHQRNSEWIEKMISNMHLGEMRERFVKHLMFDQPVDNETRVDHVEPSDDIEIF